jgi:small-conductance mechanosensitive channel
MSLTELLEKIEGIVTYTIVKVGGTPITLASLSVFLVIFVSFVVASKLLTKMLGRRILKKLHVRESTAYTIQRLTHYILVVIGAIIAFQFIGINLSGLAVILGLLSVGIGFGLQNVTSNFIAGLILLFEKPIQIGDRVTVGDTEGDVLEINMRSTTIRSLNNISIIVPNSEFISQRVINWSHGDPKVRLDVDVGVSYGSDLDTVIRCLEEVAAENGSILRDPAPEVMHLGFGDSAWNMQLRCWIGDPKGHWRVLSRLNCAIVRKFRENDVEIPFPQRDLHVRSSIPFPLKGPGAGPV